MNDIALHQHEHVLRHDLYYAQWRCAECDITINDEDMPRTTSGFDVVRIAP